MLDCQVLSFAVSSQTAQTREHGQQQRDSEALLKNLSEVRVSSIVVLELLRSPPSVSRKIRTSGILEMLNVEPVDAAISMAAADLLERARGQKDLCSRCFNVRSATACRECGQLVSHQQKTHDALIVATASVLADVEILYSYDPGVFELAKFAPNVRVMHPDNVDGPLFKPR